MQINSTQNRAVSPPSMQKALVFEPIRPTSVSNAEPDKVVFSEPKKALTGALLGAAGLGLSLQAAGAGMWSLAGVALGATAGAWVGENLAPLSYDAKSVLQYTRRRFNAERLNKTYSEKSDALSPLEESHRIAHDPSSDVKRRFDGYDSSRNITGLFSDEGSIQKPYRLAIEFAHLRPGAQKDHLNTVLTIGTGKGALKLEVKDDNVVLGPEGPLGSEQVKSKYSVRYNQLILELDKGLLRERGWQDGHTLSIKAETREGEARVPFDSVAAMTGDSPGEAFFRWEGKTIYQILTDRFANGDKSNDQDARPGDPQRFHGGDWQGVIDNLDYLNGLGVDCIWLSCPYKNDRDFFGQDGYHGYWPHDFAVAEPSFGDKEKLAELVEKAHQKGMKVLLDVVVNHTGYNHPSVRDSEYRDWFHREGARNPFSQYYLENGSLAGLPDLAQENPDVTRYLIDIHKMWQRDTKVDGFRVDAIRHVPGSFLREFDNAMKEDQEGFITVGEVFWNDPHYLAGYQNETQDSLFDFPLMQATRDVFGGNPDLTLGERWQQFQEVKQHNFGQAIMDLTKPGGSSMKKLSDALARDHAYDNPRLLSTILDNHDTGRFLSHAGGDHSKLKMATGFLFGCRGTPSLYYGTETGMEGQMGHNREDMDFENAPELRHHIEKLVKVRKESAALQFGTQTELFVDESAYVFSRVLPGNEVLCAFNNSEEERTLTIPLSDTQIKNGDKLKSLLEKGKNYLVKDDSLELVLPSKGFTYLDWRD